MPITILPMADNKLIGIYQEYEVINQDNIITI